VLDGTTSATVRHQLYNAPTFVTSRISATHIEVATKTYMSEFEKTSSQFGNGNVATSLRQCCPVSEMRLVAFY